MTLKPLQIGALAACAGASLCAFSLRAQDAAPEPALATYQGGVITRADYEQTAASKVPEIRIALEKSAEKRRELLDAMIDFELLLLEAERRGYGDHPLVTFAMREESVRRLVEGPLVVTPESLPDADVKAEYEKRKAELDKPERRRARHVVLATEAEAKALIAEARKAGSDAADLIARAAREKSIDAESKQQSGELGYLLATGERPGQKKGVDAEIARAVFALKKKNDVSPQPIPVTGGFSVLVLLERIEATKMPQAAGLQAVREELAARRTAEATEALVAELTKANAPQTFPERVDAIALDPPATAGMPQGFSAAPKDPTAPPVIVEPDGF